MILGPIATGAGLLWLKPDQFRKILVGGITLLVAPARWRWRLLPAAAGLGGGLPLDHHWLSLAMMLIEGAAWGFM